MKKRYLPIVFLCTALFTGYGVKAQDVFSPANAPVPVKMRGNWALPDCRSYDEALMITRHFYLKSTRAGSQFWPVESVGSKKDYWLVEIDGEEHPARVEEDGVLKIGNLSTTAPEEWPEKWDALALDGKHEYMGCDDLPNILPDPLVRVMIRIDRIEEACSGTMTENCRKLLFSIGDVDKDKKISVEEMRMAGAMLAGFAAIVENYDLSKEALNKTFLDSFNESGRVFNGIAMGKDWLTYKDFKGFLKKAESEPMEKALESIGGLFPALRASGD